MIDGCTVELLRQKSTSDLHTEIHLHGSLLIKSSEYIEDKCRESTYSPFLAPSLLYLLPPRPVAIPHLSALSPTLARTALHPPLPRSRFKGTTAPASSSSSSPVFNSYPHYLHLRQAHPSVLLLRLLRLSSSPSTGTLTRLVGMPLPDTANRFSFTTQAGGTAASRLHCRAGNISKALSRPRSTGNPKSISLPESPCCYLRFPLCYFFL
jgi:hypothetical protein